jgi:FkbM family methyltransferase
MKILYGIENNNIDVTEICFSKLVYENNIIIPPKDGNRAQLFTDPLDGILKKIFISTDNYLSEYDEDNMIKINIINKTIEVFDDNTIEKNIDSIHSKLKFNHGSLKDEYPEQSMAIRYLTGHEKVLEIGGNIGRNSLLIGYILGMKNNNNMVVLEPDEDIAKKLYENRDLNNFNFNIEVSALSKRKLIKKKGDWRSVVSDKVLENHTNLNTITLDDLNAKYNIEFDTLVLDCEGAFYYILMDMPEILNNINLIIMENDFCTMEHKNYVDQILKKNKFFVHYSESLIAPWGWQPGYDNFYEVWMKKN